MESNQNADWKREVSFNLAYPMVCELGSDAEDSWTIVLLAKIVGDVLEIILFFRRYFNEIIMQMYKYGNYGGNTVVADGSFYQKC